MGNGAPDLSANISAVRNGSVQLSAGALTGEGGRAAHSDSLECFVGLVEMLCGAGDGRDHGLESTTEQPSMSSTQRPRRRRHVCPVRGGL